MNKSPIISVRDLKAFYGDRLILDSISFDVYPGEIFLVIGGSGCGKTTLMNCIIGLHKQLNGQIFIDGDDIVAAESELKKKILKKIGVMYQLGALFGSLTLLENVMFPLEELSDIPKEIALQIAKSKLNMVGLGNFLDFMPAEISGGMQKRAAIARAMALEPKIVFLDEPVADLDPITAAQIDNLILMLSQVLNITFVTVTHELASIFKIGKRVIMLHDKKIIAQGAPQYLLENSKNEIVQKFFNRQA